MRAQRAVIFASFLVEQASAMARAERRAGPTLACQRRKVQAMPLEGRQSQAKIHRDQTIDPEDVAKFDRLGAEWWDPEGPMRALHRFNPLRVTYLEDELCRRFPRDGEPRDRGSAASLAGLTVLDIGCGGGLLAEAMARHGAAVTAIDPAPRNIEAAQHHAAKAGLSIDYRCVSAEELAAEGAHFDAVLTMEVIEHVRDVTGFLRTAASLVRPGGMLFAATLNRTFKSYAFAIVGAEYVLGWVPRGTHSWDRFVTPDELARALRAAGLEITGETGAVYDPLRDQWRLSRDMDINYMMSAHRPPARQ
jgi:2-polyprenyl-6-hydroxyphenyl methylase/3-demethylubiquinone-9 3-methyltransferase